MTSPGIDVLSGASGLGSSLQEGKKSSRREGRITAGTELELGSMKQGQD